MKFNKSFIAFLVFSCFSIIACTQNPPPTPIVSTTTNSPIPINTLPLPTSTTFACEDVDLNWGANWEQVILALDSLIDLNQSCGAEPLPSKKYAAHFNYASALESSEDLSGAVQNYTAAYLIDPKRNEALNALIRLNALPAPTPVACPPNQPELPPYSNGIAKSKAQFIQVKGNTFIKTGDLYSVKGVNYYPRNAPWHRFLTDADLAEIETELGLVSEAGFNTIRIFLWYEPLFICQPEDAIPDKNSFEKLDQIILLAKQNGLNLIVTLNDLPDLVFRPLYTDWEHYNAQTAFIVQRYKDEPAILAWDVRNEGDLDYGARDGDVARFSQAEVLSWLEQASNLITQNDQNHLITAGWWGDPTDTAPYVDFLSFHHWANSESLQNRIDSYTQNTDKPILLEEIGYHSWANAPTDQREENYQADLLNQAVKTAESSLSGWVIWTAFDFVPQSEQATNYEHHFGLWRTDLTAKPALESLRIK